jgi:hypothetical protein
MTISEIRRTGLALGLATGLLLSGSAASGQVTMPFPRIGGVSGGGGHSITGQHLSPMQVTPMRVTPFQPSQGFRAPLSHGTSLHSGSLGGHGLSDSGLHISATVGDRGDRFSGRLHIGSDLGLHGRSDRGLHGTIDDHTRDELLHDVRNRALLYGYSAYGAYSGFGYYPYNYGYGYRGSYYPVVDGSYYSTATSAQPQLPAPAEEPTEPPTDEEIAAGVLRFGDAGDAVDLYRGILRDEPQDAVSMRRLAVALLKDTRLEEGVAMMAMAYRTDALLADDAIDKYLFDDAADLRRLLQKAVMHANRTKLASAWLTVAVLMQAEDRDDRALKMLDKAGKAGLDTVVVDSFKRAHGG